MSNFMEDLLKRLQERKSDNYEFQLMEVAKINDGHKTSLCIRQKGNSIGANLYMDDLVRRYENSDCDMELLVEDIMQKLKEGLLNTDFVNYAMEQLADIKDYNKVKEKIVFRIVNEEANKEYLKNSVYVPFLDFAICFYLVVSTGEEMGTIQLTRDIISIWNVPIEEIYQQALLNTPILMPYQFRHIVEVLKRMMLEDCFTQSMEVLEADEENFGMWVLGNVEQMYGAGVILYDGLMREISTKIGVDSIVILPSSVHECVLIPKAENMDIYYLKSMVREVNDTNLGPEERLSENIYLYSRATDEITILKE